MRGGGGGLPDITFTCTGELFVCHATNVMHTTGTLPGSTLWFSPLFAHKKITARGTRQQAVATQTPSTCAGLRKNYPVHDIDTPRTHGCAMPRHADSARDLAHQTLTSGYRSHLDVPQSHRSRAYDVQTLGSQSPLLPSSVQAACTAPTLRPTTAVARHRSPRSRGSGRGGHGGPHSAAIPLGGGPLLAVQRQLPVHRFP